MQHHKRITLKLEIVSEQKIPDIQILGHAIAMIENDGIDFRHVNGRIVESDDYIEYTPEEIREIRTAEDMSQRAMACLMGVAPNTVQGWECGRTKPHAYNFKQIEEFAKRRSVYHEKY